MANMNVRYMGMSTYRVLTEQDMKQKGVSAKSAEVSELDRWHSKNNPLLSGVNPDTDLVWGPHNDYTVVMDVDSTMEEFLRREGHFALTSAEGETIAEAEDPTHPGDVVQANEEGTPAQRSKVKRG